MCNSFASPFALGESGFLISGPAALLLIIGCYVYWSSTSTDIKLIPGLFEIPESLPFAGHLYRLGEDHATACEQLWLKHKKSTFQIRLGSTRAVVANSFDDCRRMLINNQSSVIDRPVLHTNGVIASTKGLTIGASPWDESTKQRRKAAGTTLARPKLKEYHHVFDLESYCVVRDLANNSNAGELEVSVKHLIQRYALNTTLTLCYGIRMDSGHETMLDEILEVGHAISLLRGASENYQDYIPLLRYFPNNEKTKRSRELCGRRDRYLEGLLATAEDKFVRGIQSDCVYSAVLKDKETNLSHEEISSVCLSLVSGGFETVPGTLISCIGSLSTPENHHIQEAAYEDIKRYYPHMRDAWDSSFRDESIPYINAIIKETLRYYTVTPMNLPRKTIKDIHWDGCVIPAKTMVLLNTQAANHDVSHFGADAYTFNPERWLQRESPVPTERKISGIQHFAFGGGSRLCPGIAIANRLLYTALVRIISAFRIEASEEAPPTTHYSDFNSAKTALVAIPKDFRIKLIPRDPKILDAVLDEAQRRTMKTLDI